tara:strand:+ start:329 stop:580 length:252 start_codon:yes stop_codon:yes gene_type:complete
MTIQVTDNNKLVPLKNVKDYIKRHPLLFKIIKKLEVSTYSEGDTVYNKETKNPKEYLIPITTLAYSFREALNKDLSKLLRSKQ